MKEIFLWMGILLLIISGIIVIIVGFNEDENINQRRSICEDAGYNFEIIGDLNESKNEDSWWMPEDKVILTCYEIRKNVKKYIDFDSLEYIREAQL